MYKNELEIDVFRCFRALCENAKYIVIVTILFFLVGIGLTLDAGDDTYSAKATVYASGVNSYSDATAAVTAMNAYIDVAKSYKVSQRAALLLGRGDIEVEDIQNSIYVTSSEDRQGGASLAKSNSATIISFTATTLDPDLSMAMADAMAQAYTIEMSNILQTDSVKVLDNAYSYYMSYNASKNAWKTRIKITLMGFAFACAAIVIFEVINKKVRTIREATIANKLPVIGVIPDYKK